MRLDKLERIILDKMQEGFVIVNTKTKTSLRLQKQKPRLINKVWQFY